ncbi:hypothetical protein VTK73DRAFT_4745 [Phialemonium thermophilum]|uniref:Uncharacterized protein n=1 Tax=Phialemonium thermophilum TaxID=223376 RepID=A0ABR3V6R7_9PEZI
MFVVSRSIKFVITVLVCPPCSTREARACALFSPSHRHAPTARPSAAPPFACRRRRRAAALVLLQPPDPLHHPAGPGSPPPSARSGPPSRRRASWCQCPPRRCPRRPSSRARRSRCWTRTAAAPAEAAAP